MTSTSSNLPPGLCICRNPECAIPYGLCHCGCGQQTKLANYNDHRDRSFFKKGRPTKFLKGHQFCIKRDIEDAAPFKIDGVYCRLIPLSKGYYSIVDATDYEWLMQWRWFARVYSWGVYAWRNQRLPSGKKIKIPMHREILRTEGNKRPDHKNCVALDNRRKNLRPADATENMRNRRKSKNNTSGFKCVQKGRHGKGWQSNIMVDGKTIYLGTFATKEEAHAAYCEAAIKYFGEFARFG